MFNVQIAGRLGKDPETRFTPTGQKVTTFNIATTIRKGREEVTVWVRVTVWGDRFDKMMPYIKKGSGLIVSGKMSPPTSYVDKEGRTQISIEITAESIEFNPFGKNESGEGQGQAAQAQQNDYSQNPAFAASNHANPQPNNNNSNVYASQFGQGANFSNDQEDDNLPF